ncbi:GGA1 (YDR358W) and GGA2 (YHR108W) [Zygosaccharomyces parabailii]|nr:GGA1 (YDR358W) and GGA2 (YHR108W) [Zygosaccharomyces parabailii]CDH14173.1 probable ADP-ribosylation factor-binding protein GGA2 [Zygosaccharomyces bailii ISA1307]
MSQGIYLSDGPIRRPQPVGNPLLRKIQRSCRLSLPEPDLALNLDVADYINEKQGPAPRDAVIAIVKLINSRDTHTAVFALALLDVLVKNCGYPLHLQISRKEFLNELVKRFPEHPPMRYSKVQRLVLTAIEEWYQTICKHSSYKEDLGYIRDMHRLLKYKGYIFPKINESDMAVLRPTEQLKTPSEIQKEQEVAQAAKLEELIRRGRPEDLREANKLMKIMAGFKEDNAREAKQAILTELNKLKRKADLLNEMLASSEAPDLKNETVTELHTAIKSAQPKFQKIIEEEHEDDELVQDLLKFNDTVNQLLKKFELLKAGDSGAASQIRPSNISAPAPATGGALATEINLIDFDDEPVENGNPAAGSTGATAASSGNGDIVADLLGDLSDLSFSSASGTQNFGMGGSIQLGATQPAHPVTIGFTSQNNSNLDLPTTMSSQGSTQQFGVPQSSDLDVFGEFSKPSTKTLVNQSSNLKIEANLIRESKQSIKVTFFFSNMTSSAIKELTHLVAVPKDLQLRLLPQSDSTLEPFVTQSVTQDAFIESALGNFSAPVKMKWKVTYKIEGRPVEETAVFILPKV